MTRVIGFILDLHGGAAYVLVFALPALESSAFLGFLFPGELAIVLGGVLAFQGRGSLPLVMAAAIGGAILGGSVGYLGGARWGGEMFRFKVGRQGVTPQRPREAQGP